MGLTSLPAWPRSSLVLLFWCSVISTSFLTLEPTLVGIMIDRLHVSAEHAGLISAAHFASSGLGSYLFLPLTRLLQPHVLARISVILVAGMDGTSAFIEDPILLLAARLLGAMSSGLIVSATLAAAARMPEAAKIFAVMMSGQLAFGMVGYLTLPWVLQVSGLQGALLTLAACPVLALLLWKRFNEAFGCKVRNARHPVRLNSTVLQLYVSLFLMYVANTAIWTYLDRIGTAAGLASTSISAALALSMTGGLLGSGLAWMLAQRVNALAAVRAGLAVMAFSVLLLTFSGAGAFSGAAIALNASQVFVVPFYLAMLAKQAHGDRRAVMAGPVISIGLVVGPLAASQLVDDAGYGWLIVAAAAIALVSLLLTWAQAAALSALAKQRIPL